MSNKDFHMIGEDSVVPFDIATPTASASETLIGDGVVLEGFKTDKDFARFLCRQVIGMRQDLANGDGDKLLTRILSVEQSAQHYLMLYGHGISPADILGNGKHL